MNDRPFALAYAALAVVYLAPLAVTAYLPAFDLPHHLAIVDALAKSGHVDSPYARDFDVGWKLSPFVVHYALLRALALVMPLTLAAKVLVGAVVLTLPLATARLLAVSGGSAVFALASFPLAYSMPLHYGLIGFVVALPLVVWMVAEACNEAAWRARPRRAAAVLATLSMLTLLSHLEAWAAGAAAAVLALLLSQISWRTRALGIASIMPSAAAAALFVLRIAGDATFSGGPSVVRGVLAERLRELAEHGTAVDVWSRIRGLPIHLLRGFNDGSDLVAARVFFVAVAIVAAARVAIWIFRREHLSLRPRPVAAAAVVALAAYLGLPHHLPHAVSIYPRFAVLVGVFLLAACAIPKSTWPRAAGRAIVAAIALAAGAYGLVLIRHYAQFGREVDDFRYVASVAPTGLSSGGLVFDAESSVMNIEGIFTGIPVYYVFERPGPRSSTWLHYCADPQVPCRVRDTGRVPPLPFFSYPSRFDPERALQDLELVFVAGGPPAGRIFGAHLPRVRLLAERGRWRAFARRPSIARALHDEMRVSHPQ